MIYVSLFTIFGISSFLHQTRAEGIGNWTLTEKTKNGTEYTCIRMVGELTLFLDYKAQLETNLTVVNITVPTDAKVNEKKSTCNLEMNGTVDEQILVLDFFQSNDLWSLTFKFTNNTKYVPKNDFIDVYQVSLTYTLDEEHFPNAEYKGARITTENVINSTTGEGALKLFSTMNDRSYKCHSTIKTVIKPDNFTLQTKDFQVEAFLSNKTDFLRATTCSQDLNEGKSDLIPIIIGAALAALVVIVLIAYLIGRARAKRTVYETI